MTLFASKTPAEPRREYMECRHGDYPEGDWLDDCVLCSPVWEEYPHVQRNEPNPILVDIRLRGLSSAHVTAPHVASLWVDEDVLCERYPNAIPAHIEHARKVLSRLAAQEALEA